MRGLLWPRKDMGLASLYRTAVMQDGPVGYWRLGDSGTVAKDETANVLDGGYLGSPLPQGTVGALEGDANRALVFAGGTGWVSVGDSALLDIGLGSKTWESWARTSATTRVGLLRKSDASNANGFLIDVGDSVVGQTKCALSTGVSAVTAFGGRAVNDGRWHHLVCVLDRAAPTLSIFLDGVLDVTVSAAAAAGVDLQAISTLTIGALVSGTPWIGAIDEVAIYPMALTPSKILNHYRIGAGWAAVASPQSWITGALHPAANPVTGTRWPPVTGARMGA